MNRTILFLLLILFGCEGRSAEEANPPPTDGPGAAAPRSGDSARSESVGGADGDSVADEPTPEAVSPSQVDESPGIDMVPYADSTRSLSPSDFPHPEFVRGIYLNAWTAGSTRRREALIAMAGRTELNTFVIDIKDASGYISHDTGAPMAREVGATGERRIRDLPGLLRRLKQSEIYPIARIVVAKDPILSSARPELAIQDSNGGVWVDQKGALWLNLFHKGVWQYHVDLAVELARMGFPEIQWDYIRFPDSPDSLLARTVYPGREGRERVEAVRDFLGYAREVLEAEGVRMTADVFGVTTSYRRDVGIGQVWESFIDQVEVALPMVYPSHYWPGSFGYQNPNAYPYEIVRRAMRDALSRSARVEGAGSVRPWLQDFSLGQPPYGAPEVRAQIQATYDAGIQEWILWNPGNRYTEGALASIRPMPSWLEPLMRVGGQVVPVSRRYEVLGEEAPEGPSEAADSLAYPDLEIPLLKLQPKPKVLPPLRPPDTVNAAMGG
jgi:hypothetical protein